MAVKMNPNRATALAVAAALALAGCGDGDEAASRDAAPTATATATATASSEPTPAPGKCDEVKYTPVEAPGTLHPGSNFFAPDTPDAPSKADLDHLLLFDNAVVVTYAANTPAETRQRLEAWTFADVVERTPVVVPDHSADALPVRARIASRELRCNGVDWKRLTAFANRKDIAPRSGHG